METKAQNPITLLEGRDAPVFMRAYFEFSQLKQLYRQGWLKQGIPAGRCESVAEHTFGVAVLAYWLAEAYFPELDANRVIRLALLHDFGEIYAGDIIPEDGVSHAEKEDLERGSVSRVFAGIPQGEEYLKLWEDYENGSSPEARFVKEIDRLEMALQASVYEHQGFTHLDDFFDSASQGLSDSQILELMRAILANRISQT